MPAERREGKMVTTRSRDRKRAKRKAQRLIRQHLWGIVLAGGEGKRLQPFIRACLGCDRPKQYCAFIDHCSMLRRTIRRAERIIPPERLLTVVIHPHMPYVEQELYDRPSETIIVQPENRETGPGILLPLLHIHQRDPQAVVTILPSDHFILEEEPFMIAVAHAAAFVSRHPEHPVLLGVEPRGPEVEYGWIELGRAIGRHRDAEIYRVGCFWEKPSLAEADALYLKGCLWNTMVLVARARALLELFESLTPTLMSRFDRIKRSVASAQEPDVLRTVYAELPAVNFSQAILAPSPRRLGVIRVRGVYWSDWGDATRLQQDLARFGLRATLA
jgi:mannose-1-phosphate guanylyltransferase